MAYFLKKTTLKNRTYLAIYESFYCPDKKGTAHRTFKSLGSIETLIAEGMVDPVGHYQKEVDLLNEQNRADGVRKITNESPIIHLGHFLLKSVLTKLNVKKYIDYFKLTHNFSYDLYELISSLIYARGVNPCSKRRTFHEVLPMLYEPTNFSYDQLLDGLAFIGNDYEKFVEIFTVQTKSVFGIDGSKTYFDCTNFYFEIDREDDFRRKGPSKENRKDPIVGLGLLLDSNQIPIGMKMFPGNESEKPVLRSVVDNLKRQNNISGKTIHVGDKGINCAQNIAYSKENGDGYLFSKSVLGLPAKEKDWVLLDYGWQDKKDSNGKLLYSYKSCIDKFPYTFEHNGKRVSMELTEKRLLTFNPDLATKKRYEINRMVEKAKLLSLSAAKKDEYGEAAKYINFTDGKDAKATVVINQAAIDRDLSFAGYNLLVTSETKMSNEDMYNTYHNLWRIEESFRIMKSDLDARPVFVQKESTINGHFLICYLTVLLERILQFVILNNQYSATEIFDFIRKFNIIKAEQKHINTATKSTLITNLSTQLKLPLNHYFLSPSQINSILSLKL